MHNGAHHFVQDVKSKYPEYFIRPSKVLEVGSANINGSIRLHFDVDSYLGIDLGEATDVDFVCSITEYKAPRMYDVVISVEMLEHCKEWEQSLRQMYENTKPGGLFLLTCAGPNRQPHGIPENNPHDSKFTLDWYRNISKEDFLKVLPKDIFIECSIGEYDGDTDLRFWGIRKLL